ATGSEVRHAYPRGQAARGRARPGGTAATSNRLAHRRVSERAAPGRLTPARGEAMSDLTHFDEHGASRMVDTSAKPETLREARASGRVRMARATAALIRDRALAKGDVLEVARLAGILAAKRTGDLIPLCHPLPITSVALDFRFEGDDALQISATVRVFGRT